MERSNRTKLIQEDPRYAAMIESVDMSVNLLTGKLNELGLSENTIWAEC